MRGKLGFFSQREKPPETVLLLHFDGADASTAFPDASPNNISVTPVNGAAITTAQSKFDGSSANLVSGAYLTAASPKFAFSGDFTIECWFRYDGNGPLYEGAEVAKIWDNGQLALVIQNLGGPRFLSVFRADTSTYYLSSVYTEVAVNTWHHCALVRVGRTGRVSLFLDGVLLAEDYANISALLTSQNLTIGTAQLDPTNHYFSGQLDEFRVLNWAAYGGYGYTPPALSFKPAVALLLHFDGADASTVFTDDSPNNLTVTANGSAQISTAQSKFGGASGYFDGSGAYLSIAENPALDLGNGDFTIEFWVYTQDQSFLNPPYLTPEASSSPGSFVIRYDSNGYAQKFTVVLTPTFENYPLIVSASTFPFNAWYYVAFVRSGNRVRLYVNGVEDAAALIGISYSLNLALGGSLQIGGGGSVSQYAHGYIDELRITRNAALYTANFPVPTANSAPSLWKVSTLEPVYHWSN
jgi:hypothetical protein